MIKITLIILAIIFISYFQFNRDEADSVESLCELTTKIRKCPTGLGRLFLPRTYSARAIYVGFSIEKIHNDFLKKLINEISNMEISPKLNILIPNNVEYEALEELKQYFNNPVYHFINLIPTSSKESVWAQDYLEILFNTNTGMSEIVDLPYYGREGEDLPSSIALICQKELIHQAQFTDGLSPGNGDYGGNIEAITTKVLAVGNNLSNETYKVIENLTSQDLIDLDVSWLDTGHVDELITTLPNKKNAGPCDQALLIASPQLGIDTILKTKNSLKEYKNPFNTFRYNDEVWTDHFHCLFSSNKERNECKELFKANIVYQEIIDEGVRNLQKLISKNHGCKLEEERIPQLFVPFKKMKSYGNSNDRAVSLNPNSVNNIYFYPNLMLARQPFKSFQDIVDKVLNKFPFNLIFIDDRFAHELNGGIHCATNISYGCAP